MSLNNLDESRLLESEQPSELQMQLIAFYTLMMREVRRFLRIWPQTLLPAAMTMVLYFVIFGQLIGSRIGPMGGVDYMQYVVPGLVMMSVITNSFTNVAFSFFSGKFQRHVEELLVSPASAHAVLLGFLAGGLARGLTVGAIVMGLALFFTDLTPVHWGMTFVALLLTALLFALCGFINGMMSNKFEDVAIVPTFVLTPLTYLGGVFYSISILPDFWQAATYFNPVLYVVNAFRYGILGVSDGIDVTSSLICVAVLCGVLYGVCYTLLNRGYKLRH